MRSVTSAVLLERRHHLAAEQLARGDRGEVVDLVAQALPLEVGTSEEVRQPTDARLREHQREVGVPFERAGEHHRRQRLVELQRQDRGERSGLPLADLIAEPRGGPALEVEADRDAGAAGRRPQPVPGPIADVDREDVDDGAAMTEVGAAFELGCGGVRRVAGQEREDAQPLGRDRVELLHGPVVPCRVARRLQLGVGDRQAERERSVDHRRGEPVAVHVLQAQLRRCRRGSRRRRCRRARSR